MTAGIKSAGPGEVGSSKAAHDRRVPDQQRRHILLRLERTLDYAANRTAAPDAAGHLGNDEAARLQLRMMFAVVRQALGNLLRRSHSQVGDDVAVQRAGIIEVDDFANE